MSALATIGALAIALAAPAWNVGGVLPLLMLVAIWPLRFELACLGAGCLALAVAAVSAWQVSAVAPGLAPMDFLHISMESLVGLVLAIGARGLLERARSAAAAATQATALLTATEAAATHDVTELRRRLAESISDRALIESCLGAAGIGYWVHDHAAGTSSVDAHYTGMIGYSQQEYGDPDHAWVEHVHPEDFFRLQALGGDPSSYESSGRFSLEYRMRHRDGHWLWVLDSGCVLEWQSEGVPARVAGVHIDITARKIAEIELEDAKDYAERLISAANAIAVGLDLQGGVEVFNPAAERATGYSLDELRGRRWFDVVLPRMRYPELCAEVEQRSGRGDVPTHWEYPILAKSGEERHIVWQNSLLLRKGELAGTLAFGLDVTERRRAEQAAEAANSRLLLALRAGGIGIWEVDLESGDQFWDAQMYSLFGLPAAAGDDPQEVVANSLDAASMARSLRAIQRARESDLVAEDEYAIRLPDGVERFLKVHAAVLSDPHTGRRRLVGATWDFTAQRLAEAGMQSRQVMLQQLVEQQTMTAVAARQRAERAALMQSEFLANVSHELRSPLHVIIGFIDLADEVLDQVETEEMAPIDAVRHKLSRSNAAAKRLLALVDDLLDLAKLESGRMDLNRERSDATRLAESALDEFEPLLLARRIGLQRVFPEGPIAIAADERRVGQVLRNVLANAARFSPDGGTIRITVSRREATDAAGVEIRIDDEGPGIPEGEMEAIFDKFVQSSRTKTGRPGSSSGTGLGLPIAREIMRAHGGSIVAGNRAAGGARFTITFPQHSS